MGDPVGAARHAATTLAPGGTVMLVERFAHDGVEDNLTTVGHLYYGGSTVICCAHAISEGGKLVLGAQAGPKRRLPGRMTLSSRDARRQGYKRRPLCP